MIYPLELYILFVFLFGLIWGSFINVCILRIPEKKTLGGRSKCPKCQNQISWYDNIPFFSYVFLKGKCRYCKIPISPLYPSVELLCGAFSVATLLLVDFDFLLYLTWYLSFILPLVVITFIDFKHYIIPDKISIPGIFLGIIASQIIFWPNWQNALVHSLLGILVGGGSLLLISLLFYWIKKKEGLGGGDIKMMAMLGAFMGYHGVIFIFIFSSFLGLFFALINFAVRKKSDQAHMIPFGPFLAIAAVLLLFFGNEITQKYFEFSNILIDPLFPFLP